MYTWIRSTTITLSELLKEHFEADDYLKTFFNPASGGTSVITAATPQEMSDANETGLSVWLYRIVRDDQLLNYPPRRVDNDRVEGRRLPLRLHYLMTPIIESTDNGVDPSGMEQSVIGKVLQTLHDHPLLDGALLRDDLVGSGVQIAVRLEPLDLEGITRIWDALEQSYQLCVSYEVSVVLLASDDEDLRISPVNVVEPEYGIVTGEGMQQ